MHTLYSVAIFDFKYLLDKFMWSEFHSFFSHNLISDVAIKKFKFNNSSQDKKE